MWHKRSVLQRILIGHLEEAHEEGVSEITL